jgi:hypothetical protein
MGENTHSLAEPKQEPDMAGLPTNPIGRSCEGGGECGHLHYNRRCREARQRHRQWSTQQSRLAGVVAVTLTVHGGSNCISRSRTAESGFDRLLNQRGATTLTAECYGLGGPASECG